MPTRRSGAGALTDVSLLDPRDQWQVLVDHFTARFATASLDDWIVELCEATRPSSVSLRTIRSVIGRLAWVAREKQLPIEHESTRADTAPTAQLYRAYFIGERLRYDFRFREMGLMVPKWRLQFQEDALLMAFEAFARLGVQDERGIELFNAALAATDVDDRVEFVCLHAMWFGTGLPDQGELLLALSDRMLASGHADHVLHYRRAFALRRLGRYPDALRSVDEAISQLDPGNSSFVQIHQDYVRERELIITSSILTTEAALVVQQVRQEVERAVDERLAVAQSAISESLLKLIEILGLFVTLAGFIAASGVSLSRAPTWWQATLSVALAGLGSIAFFFVLRLVVNSRR